MRKSCKWFSGYVTRRKFIKQIWKASLGSAIVTIGTLPAGCTKKEDEREMHKSEIIQFQNTCKPIINELLGAKNYNRFCEAALREYDSFAAQIPLFESNINKSQFFASGPYMLSNYRALQGEFSFDQAKALDVLRHITNFKVRKKFENPSLLMKFIYPRIAKYDFLRDLTLKRFTHNKDEKYGWATVFPKSDAYIAVDYTKCGLSDWFRDQGAPEIAPIACEGDYIWTGLLTGLKFIRTKTIANGDGICDFRFVKHNENEHNGVTS